MAVISNVTLKGSSGSTYKFIVYNGVPDFKGEISCVYYVSKRSKNSSGEYYHTEIYIGETGDFNERFLDHHKMDCFEEREFNVVSVHSVSDKNTRHTIEQDLIAAIDPPCNG